MSLTLKLFVLGLLAISPVVAQTFTDCDPTLKDCPADLALGVKNYTVDFTKTLDATVWNATSGTLVPSTDGSKFTINKRFDSPTIKSNFNIFFGTVEVHMKAALGQGIISSIVLQSDDLDEIDWEFMGGNNTHAQTNYFGKGNQTVFDRAIYHPVATPSETFHNYTLHWTSDKLEWYIDTNLVRTLMYADANGGHNYPQTPMTVRLGIWAGGDPGLSNGTIEWAGGITDFTKGPYTMYVQSAKISDFSTGRSYVYGDRTGSWQSIKSVA
jgi:beta-glucanase (GH16 family)